MKPRHAQRRDANESHLVDILGQLGVPVRRMQPAFPGWPDSLAIVSGVPHFPEFKTASGVLTDDQLRFRAEMSRLGVDLTAWFPVLSNVDEVIAWVQRRRAELWKGALRAV